MTWHANSIDQTGREFLEWAALFSSSGLFVKIVAYVDESGTHDLTGRAKGSENAIFAAMIAKPETWQAFHVAWKKVLIEYNAPYFHFCEWSEAAMVARGKRNETSKLERNPYRGWSHRTLDEFIIKLAKVAGSEEAGKKVMFAPGVRVDRIHELKTAGKISSSLHPYYYALDQFFDGILNEISNWRPHWKGIPVSFFFDQGDKEFSILALELFCVKQEKNPLFDSIAFQDKKKYLPLQAADMLAYRIRQIIENQNNKKLGFTWEAFDNELFRPVLANQHINNARPDDVLSLLRIGFKTA